MAKRSTDGANSTNECSEALLVALKHPDFSGRLEEGKLPGSDPIGNTDDDIFNAIPSGSNSEKANEVIAEAKSIADGLQDDAAITQADQLAAYQRQLESLN